MDGRRELIDAAYRLDLTQQQQLGHLLAVMERHYEPKQPLMAGISSVASGQPIYRGVAELHVGPVPLVEMIFDERAAIRPEDIGRMFYGSPRRHSLSTYGDRGYHRAIAALGVPDFVGLACPTGTGASILIGARHEALYDVSAGEAEYWQPVADHLASGLRLRDQVGPAVDAVFRVDRGAVEPCHLEPAAAVPSAREELRKAVVHRERRRAKRRASELEPALVSGHWTLIDRFEDAGRRYLLAIRNPRPVAPPLTPRERAIIAGLERGEANKSIGIDLEISEATVSRTAKSALAKLGITLAEVIAAGHASINALDLGAVRLGLVPLPDRMPLPTLTPAERAAVVGSLRGHRTSAIARGRGISIRTVVNQLASAYHKLGVRSRRELILVLSRG
ncbi:MAG: helix-turn-helix transcriptional regulator [Kofleriaceae bacterium]